ncbi:YhcH/YjgK/YiaL family protein [Vibrio nomapromontoriensis]|uniref:YhcH/YjgK/YiaL family protein n=1 Tax=Vibrio nomapromontoriensis TaxID=2910246 RepID=UPI003D0B0F22
MMIISTIDSSSIDPLLHPIINRVLAEDLSALPDGISAIDGEDIFVNRVRAKARNIADSMAELHREYIDIHLTLSGTETIGFAVDPEDLGSLGLLPFKNDCVLQTNVPNEQFVTLEKGQYCVFYPLEWHRPMIRKEGIDDGVNKVVIKVRASIL